MPTGNRLLDALSAEELAAIAPDLEPVELGIRQIAFEANVPIETVYFVVSGIVSIVSEQNGTRVEVATVGNEGMVGLPVFLGTQTVPLTAFAQIPGRALAMRASAFRAAVATPTGGLHAMVSRYTEALFYLIAQSAACRSLHVVEQRCARWLLTSHDRVDGDRFPLTQEFLGQMLGVRRATVTETQGELRRRGLIDYSRGEVTIVDRSGLERVACVCYGLIENEFRTLLGNGVKPQPAAV